MRQEKLSVSGIPCIRYGEEAESVWLFLHGKCGCKEEAAAFAETVCPRGSAVFAFDWPQHGERAKTPGFAPWHTVPELRGIMAYLLQHYGSISLRANSIGAWFALQALADTTLQKALFVSPLLDMERLIRGMMAGVGVSEEQLRAAGEIATPYGETLSWRYLQYAVQHPVTTWHTPTAILYAGQDAMTDRSTAEGFARRFGCGFSVMEEGEHWFHTPQQLAVLKKWEETNT